MENQADTFLPYEKIIERLETIASQHDAASLKFVGPVAVVEINTSSHQSSPSGLPQAWLQGGLHACEWIGPAVTLRLLEELLSQPELLKLAEWHVAPVVEAAGYQQTWAADRYFRASENGENPNLNFPFEWGECSPWLKWIAGRRLRKAIGPHAASAESVIGIISALRALPDLQLFVDFHGFGRRWLHPWGHTKLPSKHIEAHQLASSIAVKAANDASKVGGYRAHAAARMETPMGGTSLDFVHGELNCVHSYAVELPPSLPWLPGALLRSTLRGDPWRWWKEGMEPDKATVVQAGDEMKSAIFALAKHIFHDPA